MDKPNAVLAKLTVGIWAASKADKDISEEVAVMKGATGKAGKYVKNLLDPITLKEVRAASTALRTTHYDLTRPWDDSGRRLLPGNMVEEYSGKIKTLTGEFDDAVKNFINQYPELVEQARLNLGQMFQPEQYPPAETMDIYFNVQTSYEPIPDGAALPMTMRDREELAKQIGVETSNTMKASATALFHRTVGTIRTLHDRLEHYDEMVAKEERTRFHNSILREIRDLAELLPKLNIEGDAFLYGIAERLKEELRDISPEELKESSAERKRVMALTKAMADEVENH